MDEPDDRWFASQRPSTIRTEPRTSGLQLDALYGGGTPGPGSNRQLSQLQELLRQHGQPMSPAHPADAQSPTHMLLNLLGLLPQHGGMNPNDPRQGQLPQPSTLRQTLGAQIPELGATGDLTPSQLQRMADLLQPGNEAPRPDLRGNNGQGLLGEYDALAAQRALDSGALAASIRGANDGRLGGFSMPTALGPSGRGLELHDILGNGPGGGHGGRGDGGSDGHQVGHGEDGSGYSALEDALRTGRLPGQYAAGGHGGGSLGMGGSSIGQQELNTLLDANAKEVISKRVEEMRPTNAEGWKAVARSLNIDPAEHQAIKYFYTTHIAPRKPGSGPGGHSHAQGGSGPAGERKAPTGPNKHGRRINPRKGIPMHIMATYALLRLPDHEGNLSDMSAKIEENEFFCKQLDWTPRPGTKTYPRWKDALVGCFKPGRYPHLKKTNRKKEGLTVYALDNECIPEKSCLKASMLQDVDPSLLPSDFDMSNPLVPLHGANVAALERKKQDKASVVTTGNIGAPGALAALGSAGNAGALGGGGGDGNDGVDGMNHGLNHAGGLSSSMLHGSYDDALGAVAAAANNAAAGGHHGSLQDTLGNLLGGAHGGQSHGGGGGGGMSAMHNFDAALIQQLLNQQRQG